MRRSALLKTQTHGVWFARVSLAALSIILISTSVELAAQNLSVTPTQQVRVSVFSLFKPKSLRLSLTEESHHRCFGNGMLVALGDGVSKPMLLGSSALIEVETEGSIRISTAAGRETGRSLRLDCDQQAQQDLPEFWLEVPGKLRRRYEGALDVRVKDGSLEAVVTMPLETAVASVVQAESPPGAAIEALKAQAVAARSFLVARQTGHTGFDFCDTTHCQFLRSPPSSNSLAATATQATQGMVLSWHDPDLAKTRPLAAMYARSCGGRTRTLREIGIAASGYPYYAVRCAYCSRHPELWQRDRFSANNAPRTEQERMVYNRIHGWSAMPSLTDTHGTKQTPSWAGRGTGHGLGLCQLGAADMARHGASFAQILAHYYPNTLLIDIRASQQELLH